MRWRLRFYAGVDDDGRQEIISQTFDTRDAARKAERRLADLKEQGLSTRQSKQRLAKYLRVWLDDTHRGQLSNRTYADYSGVLKRYIERPGEELHLTGKVRLDRLSHQRIQSLYRAMTDSGKSPRTVRSLHAVLRQGLHHATVTGAIVRNPCDFVTLPKKIKREITAMSPEEAERFLRAAKSDRYAPLWPLLLGAGLRPSEALGLGWEDYDGDMGTVHIQRALNRVGVDGWELTETKTPESNRVVALPDFVMKELSAWRVKQAQERLRIGSEYEDHGFIFATPFGRPLDRSNLSLNFKRIMAQAGLGEWEEAKARPKSRPGPAPKPNFRPSYRMYDLRHSAATLLLKVGVHPKVVSERLGHHSSAFTLDTYSATVPELQQQAAEKLEAMLGGRRASSNG